jgi:hypothetical protein
MRDRLIELLYEAEGTVNNDFPTVEQIADHLLANGVVILDPQKYPPLTNGAIIETICGEPLDDVAREIFAEIDKIADRICRTIQYGNDLYMRVGNADSPASMRERGRHEGVKRLENAIAELRKKYESEGAE